tara:strand:- start:15 stop:743 length:729 start_codon:yes stop_codon:yes gene_type:complete
MKKTTKYLLIVIIAGLFACNTEKQQVKFKKGAYLLTKTDQSASEKNELNAKINFASATLQISDNDSLTFTGFKNIGIALFGQDKFKYQISGNEILLYNDNFKETFDFEITKDSLIKLEVNKDKFKNIYFEYQTLNLLGKYQIMSFTKNKIVPFEDLKEHYNSFNSIAFEFSDNKSVIINPEIFQYLLKDSSPIDSVFQFKVQENKIVFSNSKQTFELPYSYDGIIHLYLNNDIFEKFDLRKI